MNFEYCSGVVNCVEQRLESDQSDNHGIFVFFFCTSNIILDIPQDSIWPNNVVNHCKC